MPSVCFSTSTKPRKKLMAVFSSPKKTVHFGQRGASDYTIHHDDERKERYLIRHRAREDWEDPRTAGALSRWILWGPSTSLTENIELFGRRFGLDVSC
jgi:hypothetical protein